VKAFLRVSVQTKGLIGYWGKLEQNLFATVSQEKKAFLLWSCATERN